MPIAKPEMLLLRLYVLSNGPRSRLALANLFELSRDYADVWTLEVVDAVDEPIRAMTDQIRTFPTLVKVSPPPVQRIEGNLSDRQFVLNALGIEDKRPGSRSSPELDDRGLAA